MTRLRHALFAFASALAIAAAAPAAAGEPGLPPPGVVDGATAHRLVAAGVKVVDVRTPDEFAQGHVPGAVNVPFDEIEQRREELGPPSTPLILYCHSGRRADLAIATLRAHGYDRLYDLLTYDRWKEAER
jgi:rhodanese-related sulfurtransferase